eukprot:TRINITY_DN15026_c0_g2_i1.p1 TRINITY_DN15026_c0_g2~~TRINITY_DN15026_c0_g2_i1.p1  ORF type:complete len:365 (+),score=70.82 TRINITY_DN15026_c0_g2_i1:80-1174(+)
MGNQECSAGQAECLKDLPLQQKGWMWDDVTQQQYSTPDEGGLNEDSSYDVHGGEYRDGSRPLSVEDVVEAAGRRHGIEPAAELLAVEASRDLVTRHGEALDRSYQDQHQNKATGTYAGLIPDEIDEAADSGRLPKTYFDSDIGEAPFVDDDTVQERVRHEFRSGAIYDGQWLSGMRHGVGKQTWPNGTEYVGKWHRGRASGMGEIKHSDGDAYIGQWVNGRAHGMGIYRFQDGAASYEGEFRCDHRDGMGVETWVDGSRYAGVFRQGEKSGYGANEWPDGTVYLGTWQANALTGAGQYVIHDGTTFKGQWENSTPHGVGRYQWPNGRTYDGRYHYDKKDGFGILTEVDGSVRQGFWVKGEFQGG